MRCVHDVLDHCEIAHRQSHEKICRVSSLAKSIIKEFSLTKLTVTEKQFVDAFEINLFSANEFVLIQDYKKSTFVLTDSQQTIRLALMKRRQRFIAKLKQIYNSSFKDVEQYFLEAPNFSQFSATGDDNSQRDERDSECIENNSGIYNHT